LKNNVGNKDYELAANLNREYDSYTMLANYEEIQTYRNLISVFLVMGVGLFAYSQYRNYTLYRYTHTDFLMTRIVRE